MTLEQRITALAQAIGADIKKEQRWEENFIYVTTPCYSFDFTLTLPVEDIEDKQFIYTMCTKSERQANSSKEWDDIRINCYNDENSGLMKLTIYNARHELIFGHFFYKYKFI